MATPPPADRRPTRQQLDEIDALLSRMLTLPPLKGDAAEEPAAPPVEMTFPAPLIREVPAPRPPAADDPVVREWRARWPQTRVPTEPSVVAWGSPVPLATLAEEPDTPAPVGIPSSQPAMYQAPAYIPPAAPYPVAELVPGNAPAVSPLLWPLVACNLAFGVLSHVLGPLGAWMRGPGRTPLGWVGIAMILVAAVWAAGEWLGYDWASVDLSRLDLPNLGGSRPG
jgi:hypothetical protein